ncbi:hypothetical protein [Rathayibacter sp. AY1H3]|uniref:hypothetical protein n=1 Tax=Rathayibacter sp. AY1H3 TaxID=2080567 RepID=UPI0011B002FA|nr:hypothetical protein [Rathayibacter sp. AY1H3]
MNEYYWSAAAGMAAVGGVLHHLTDSDDFRTHLGLTQGRFDRSLNHNTSQFAAEMKIGNQWHRRATLVILLSAFEKYMSSVCFLAALSDPSLEPGFPKHIEGLSLLKRNIKLAERDLEGVVKGDWSSRIAAYSRLFGPNDYLIAQVGELEKLRNARNKVAHTFAAGTQGTASSGIINLFAGARGMLSEQLLAPSEKNLLKWFDLVRGAVKSVDTQLVQEFIGGFEVVALFLEWNANPQCFEKKFGLSTYNPAYPLSRNFKKFLAVALKYPMTSRSYVESVIAYATKL